MLCLPFVLIHSNRGFSSIIKLREFRFQQIFDANGQFADAYARGVVDRCRNCGRHACHADFADAARAILIHDVVGIVEKGDIQIGQICAGGDKVIGEVAVDRLSAIAGS